MNNIKAYAVETIDGATKLFNTDEIEEAQHLFACRGTCMFALYMHPVQKEPPRLAEREKANDQKRIQAYQ